MAEPTPFADELPPVPAAPWATMLTALLILFVFAGLAAGVLYFARNMGEAAPALSGEQQLKELRAQQRDILDNYGYDPATKTWRVPVEQAMTALIDEAKSKGQMQSFPTVKAPSKEK